MTNIIQKYTIDICTEYSYNTSDKSRKCIKNNICKPYDKYVKIHAY